MNPILAQVTGSGEQHGLINVLSNSVSDDGFKHFKPEHKKQLESEKKEDSRVVDAQYLNSRSSNERLEMHYCKYAGDSIQQWKFIPGRSYKVPLGLVKQVNDKNKIMKKRSGLVSLDGEPVKRDESPLEKDEEGDWLHKFVSVGFY